MTEFIRHVFDRMTTDARSIKSNEQRLKSLEEYEREKQEKKRLIKESSTKKTHVKFDSDEDDHLPKKFEKKKIQLFDDQEPLNVEEHFNENNQPKKKSKLQNLQARLTTTNDPRFQFSEQFLDEEISLEEEKKKSLAILDQMNNVKSVGIKPKPKMVRFDPSKIEHRIYEVETETKLNDDDRVQSIDEIKPKDNTPIVDSTRVYQFDQVKLKSLFEKTTQAKDSSKENGTFQFQFFNQSDSTNEPVSKPFPPAKPISNGKSKVFLGRPDETSSEEDEEEKSLQSDEKEIKNETFFFFDIDDRLKDGLENFVRTEDLEELERTWPNKRKEIAEALRTKHRKALQRKDKNRLLNYRRRQKQSASSNPSTKSDLD